MDNLFARFVRWLRTLNSSPSTSHPGSGSSTATRWRNWYHDPFLHKLNLFRDGHRELLSTVYLVFANPGKKSVQSLQQECAHVISVYLASLGAGKTLLRLGRVFNRATSLEWYVDWKTVEVAQLGAVITKRNDLFAVVAVGTFHPNGYFRHKCLKYLEDFGGRALPFTLPLVNNWVEAIRADAYAVSKRLLQTATLRDVLDNLWVLDSLRGSQRRSDAWREELQRIAEERIAAESTALTPSLLLGLDRYARRPAYRIAAERNLFDERDALFLLHRENDAFAKDCMADSLLNNNGVSREILAAVARDKIPALRRRALQYLYENGTEIESNVTQFLFDPNQSVREYARFILKKSGIANFAAIYREQTKESPSPGAVLGLGETGDSSDAPLASSFLASSSPAMNKTALVALASLVGDNCQDILYDHVLDERTSKTAFTLIQRLRLTYPCSKSHDDFLGSKSPSVRSRLLRLILEGDSWDNLLHAVKVYRHVDDDLRNAVTRHLKKWMVGYRKPTPGQLHEIKKALEVAGLPPDLRNLIEFTLTVSGYFKGAESVASRNS